jgi:hypothetical protein
MSTDFLGIAKNDNELSIFTMASTILGLLRRLAARRLWQGQLQERLGQGDRLQDGGFGKRLSG